MKRTKLRTRTVKLGLVVRTQGLALERGAFDQESRTGTFSFSSEVPVERFFGREILDHSPGSVRLDRLNDGGPWLKDHFRDEQIGVVERAFLKDRKGMADARFSKNPGPEEERVDVEDGIRRNVSVGYLVHRMVLEESSDEDGDTFRVVDWEPLEVSNVAVPADGDVGHGRDLEAELPGLAARAAEYAQHETTIDLGRFALPGPTSKGRSMERIYVERLEDGVAMFVDARDYNAHPELYRKIELPTAAAPTAVVTEPVRVTGTSAADELAQRTEALLVLERERVGKLEALAEKYNGRKLLAAAIKAGTSFAEFRMELFEAGYTPSGEAGAGERLYPTLEEPVGLLGLDRKDVARYSLMRAIRASADKKPELAPFEMECSDEIEKNGAPPSRGFYYPADMLYQPNLGLGGAATDNWRSVAEEMLRVVSTTTQGGGSLVATNLLSGSFIDVLRNLSITLQLGATFIPGLSGNVDIPRQSAAGSAAWGGEGGAAAFSDVTLDTVQLRPKTLSIKSKITRRLMLQSTPAVEAIVRMDLAMAIALGIDLAAVSGSGAGDIPEGIINMAGVAVVALGVNGGPPTWESQVFLVKEVKKANAFQGALGFAATSEAWGKLMSSPRESGDAKMILEEPGDRLIGRRFVSSEQLPSNLVKGSSGAVASAEIFGNWLDLLIGEWGVMDLFPDPFTDGDEGAVILRAFQDADVAARHEESFAVILDMLTT